LRASGLPSRIPWLVALLALAMMLHSPLFNIACWWGVLFVWQCLYFIFASRLLRTAEAGQELSLSHFRRFVLATMLAGVWWGSAVWWLVPDNDPLYLIVVLLWLAGVAAAYAAYLTGVKSLPVLVLGLMLLIVQAKLWATESRYCGWLACRCYCLPLCW
jgi:toxin CptA